MSLKLSFLLSAVGAVTTQGGEIAAVVKMLEGAKAKLQDEHERAHSSFEKTKCFTSSNTAKNEKTIEKGNADIETWTRELDAIGGGTVRLTDEHEVYAAKIGKKQKELEEQETELDNAIQAFNANKADMESAILQLNEAAKILVLNKFNQMSKTGLANLQQNLKGKLSPSQLATVSSFIEKKQAPEAYQTQVGSIAQLVEQLKVQYQTQLNDATTDHKADEAARRADIKAQQEALDADKQAMTEGNEENAAREKRTKELNDKVNAANELINTLTENNKEMKKQGQENSSNWDLFITDFGEQMAAIDEAIGILWNDENRSHFGKVGSFIQLTKAAATQQTAIDKLKAAMTTMITQLKEEAKTIDTNMQNCSDRARKYLEEAKNAAEQVDGFSASVSSMEAAIEDEQKEQKSLQEQIEQVRKDNDANNKFFLEKMDNLDSERVDLVKGRDVVQQAIQRLNARSETSRESTFHKEVEASADPLLGVITLLANIEKKFDKEATAKQTEIDNTASEKLKSEQNLRKEITDMMNQKDESVVAMTDAEAIKNTSSERKQSRKIDLDAAMKNFGDLQQGCDYWLINGPERKNAINDEVTALNGAKAIFSKEGLGMSEADRVGSDQLAADFDAQSVSKDAHVHEKGNVNEKA